MPWRKVTRAMLAMGSERTIAAAAQRGDFFEIPSPLTST